MENVRLLRMNFDKAVADYVAALLKMYEWDSFYGYWVGDDNTGVYAYGDNYFLNLSDIIYIVDNNVPFEVFDEWCEYITDAHEVGLHIPNLPSWHKGCPRASKEEIERLKGLRKDFNDAVKQCKEKY